MTRQRGVRWHEAIEHTADAGFGASASSLPGLFEEAASALSDLTVSIEAGVRPSDWQDVALVADHLVGLVFVWLNELIALGDIGSSAVVAARVRQVCGPRADSTAGSWRLDATVGLRGYHEGGFRVVRQAKAATYHGLRVDRRTDGWALQAYLDM